MSGPADLTTVALLLGRLERLNESFVAETCRGHDTSPSDLRVLAMLHHYEGAGPVSPTTISRWIVQSTGGLTATLGRLEREGRVERSADPEDGRAKLVSLTTAGADFYDGLLADLTDRYERAMAGVDVPVALDTVRDLIRAFESFGDRAITAADWMASPDSDEIPV